MSAKVERGAPFLIAVIAGCGAAAVVFVCDIDPPPKSLAAGAMTFGIVASGFAATQRNMLLGMGGSRVMRVATSSGFHKDMLDYLMHGVYGGLLAAVVSLVGFFLNDKADLWSVWLIVLSAVVVLVLSLMLRNEVMMRRVVSRFMEEPKRQKAETG